jgi:hypothetical protein
LLSPTSLPSRPAARDDAAPEHDGAFQKNISLLEEIGYAAADKPNPENLCHRGRAEYWRA